MSTPRAVEHTAPDGLVPVSFTVNGTEVSVDVPPRMTLADLLRDTLGLTGTHIGCEHGVCGMCTILVDGNATRACLLFACQVDGVEIVTVEGLGRPDDLHPLQESFGRHHGLQCGFCTPGFLMSAYDLLDHEPEVERDQLPEELSGVICRCTGYRNIVDAVDDVATESRTSGLAAPKNCGHAVLTGRSARPHAGSENTDDTTDDDSPHTRSRPDQIVIPSGEPTVAIEVTSSLSATPDAVAQVFADVPLLASCLPGAELTDDLGDDWYAGRARVALGPIRLSFNGLAQLVEHERDRLHVRAQGEDTGGDGAQAEIRLHAKPASEGTLLRAEAQVFLVGRIAGFGRALAGDVSRRMFEDFAAAVDRAARGEQPAANNRTPSAFKLLLVTLRDRLRRARERRRSFKRSIRGRRSEQR